MIETPKTKRLAAVTIILVGFVLISSLAGLLNVNMYKTFMSDNMIPQAVAQDIVSLVVALALIFVLKAMRQGAPRCAWIWSGLVAYLFYAYALYAFDRIYTPFYPLYLSIFSLSLFGLGLLFTSLQPEALTLSTYSRQPRTLFAAYFLLNSILVLVNWIPAVINSISTKTPPEVNTIFVLDLTLFIPLMIVGAVQLWKKTLLGHSLTGMLLIKAGVMGLSIFLGQLLMSGYSFSSNSLMATLFAIQGFGGLILSVIFIRRLEIR
ncbi:hypothetical protein KAR48_07290 [bacterium]|nr:hypothetical protein [bacterium]